MHTLQALIHIGTKRITRGYTDRVNCLFIQGTSGCGGTYIKTTDNSYTYTHNYLTYLVLHAELLRRRGDTSLYTHVKADGGGSIQKAVRFVIANTAGTSWDWMSNVNSVLEYLYRYYPDTDMGQRLGIVAGGTREIASYSSLSAHFGTVTHGFATTEGRSWVSAADADGLGGSGSSSGSLAMPAWAVVLVVGAAVIVVCAVVAAVVVLVVVRRRREELHSGEYLLMSLNE